MEILKIENLSKKFNKVEALVDINLTINENEVVSIIGPSGSGKSTLLRIISDLEKTHKGSIIIDNEYLVENGKYNSDKVLSKLGLIFQDFNLFDNLNVKENVELAPRLVKKLTKEQLSEITSKLLKQVRLEDKLDAYPSTLSGGQKQRIAICRCLAMEPKIILIDEPTSALDVEAINDLVECINLLRKQNITMLIVTHDISFARKVSTRIVFMDQGKLINDLKINEIENIKDERLMKFINK